MSPEQLRGEPLDVRTDLFSFGLVLYEMATGERAFGGSTVVVAAAGILSQQPPAPRVLRAEVPEGLERSILKTLEKDRALRYQSAGELRADLMDVKRGVVPAHRILGEGGPALVPTVPVGPGAARAASQPRRSRFRSVVFALCLTAITIALVDSLQRDRPKATGNAVARNLIRRARSRRLPRSARRRYRRCCLHRSRHGFRRRPNQTSKRNPRRPTPANRSRQASQMSRPPRTSPVECRLPLRQHRTRDHCQARCPAMRRLPAVRAPLGASGLADLAPRHS